MNADVDRRGRGRGWLLVRRCVGCGCCEERVVEEGLGTALGALNLALKRNDARLQGMLPDLHAQLIGKVCESMECLGYFRFLRSSN